MVSLKVNEQFQNYEYQVQYQDISLYYTENNNLQHLLYVMKINISRERLQRSNLSDV